MVRTITWQKPRRSAASRVLLAFLFVELAGATIVTPYGVDWRAAHAKKKEKDKKKTANEAEVKPNAAASAQRAEGADEKLRTTGPAQIQVPVNEKNFDKSAKADKKRDQAIAEIQGLLPKVTGEKKGELVFRLAELYWEKSKFIFQQEFKEFDDAYQKWVEGGREGKEPQLTAYTKNSEVYKKQALDNYRVVLEQFADYPRLDEVLYFMAYNEYEAGRKKEAIDHYTQLIRQYQKSEYVSDSYLALGEYYFSANDLTRATKAYGKAFSVAKEAKRPSVYTVALYKLAWCDYNAQSYADALSKLKQVVELSAQTSDGGEKGSNIKLRREAFNDMVLTFSQLDQVKDAYAYLKKEAGPDASFHFMTKLGDIYKEQGKYALQVDTLRLLINLDPDHPRCPEFQSNIIAAFSQLGDRDAVRKEVTRMVELYGPGQSWWRKNEGNKVAVERARAVAEGRLRELVTDYHRYAQKFKKVDDYLVARDIYAQYLRAFPDAESAYRLNFYYAEILWDLGEWRNAAQQYDAVVKRDPKGEFTRVCAYNSVLAWEKIVKGDAPPKIEKGGILKATGCTEADKNCARKNDGKIVQDRVVIEKLKKGGKYDVEAIPDDEQSLANACDAYVAVVPDSKGDKTLAEELIKVKFKAAYIYHSHNRFDDAAKRFGELIERWPDTDYSRSAADIILDSYAAREQWENLEKWSRTFAKNKSLMADAKFASAVSKFMEGATFKAIQTIYASAKAADEKGSKSDAKLLYSQAGERFEKFVEEFPKSEFAPIALYNSQLIYAGAEQIDLAIRASEHLLKDYAKEIATGDNLKNRLEETTLLNLGAYREKIAQYRIAADTYVKFVDKFKDSTKAPDALYNAGVFYLGLGDYKAATAAFARYVKDYAQQKDVPDVYLRMAGIYEDQEDWKRAATLYGDFEKIYGKQASSEQLLSSRYKTAFALQKAGRDKEMREICDELLVGWKKLDDTLKKSPTGQLAGGYCAFQTLEPEYQAYKAIRIETKSGLAAKRVLAVVKDALDLKLKKRDDVAKKYLAVLEYGNGEWGVAGLARAADCLLDYVKTLRDAPDPPVLANNPEALDLFRTELENIAFPVEDQGIQALEKSLEKAFQLGIYSAYTLEIEDKLRHYKPSRFGRVYELPFFPATAAGASSRTLAR